MAGFPDLVRRGEAELCSRFHLAGVFRLSRVVQLILDAELEPAKGLSALVERVLEPGMTRYQFIDALLEVRSALAR